MSARRNGLLILTWAVLASAGAVLACWPQPDHSKTGGQSLTVAAAADLQLAFKEVGELFERKTGRNVVLIFGSSGTLATQIENGAPVDVFASANVQYVDDLTAKGMLRGDTKQLYALGRIVLASDKRSGLSLRGITDLTRPDVKRVAIANPEHAPYGAAAKQALEATGIWEQVRPKLVYGENVRQALQYVETGNVEAGIIALSIANFPDIHYDLIDEILHQPLRQAMAVVADTKHEQASREFVAFVSGAEGRPILRKYGFLLPGESQL